MIKSNINDIKNCFVNIEKDSTFKVKFDKIKDIVNSLPYIDLDKRSLYINYLQSLDNSIVINMENNKYYLQ